MSDQKYQAENDDGLVIIDGIPGLRSNKDYQRIASGLEDAANKVADFGSKQKPVVYIPSETKEKLYSDETTIDGSAFIQFGTLKDAKMFQADFSEINKTTSSLSKKCKIYTQVELNRFLSAPDDFQKMRTDEYKESRNMLWWLCDRQYRDQFVIRFRGTEFEETQVFWMDENQVKTGREVSYDASDLKIQRRVSLSICPSVHIHIHSLYVPISDD